MKKAKFSVDALNLAVAFGGLMLVLAMGWPGVPA